MYECCLNCSTMMDEDMDSENGTGFCHFQGHLRNLKEDYCEMFDKREEQFRCKVCRNSNQAWSIECMKYRLGDTRCIGFKFFPHNNDLKEEEHDQ